jgi:hypothetical protein
MENKACDEFSAVGDGTILYLCSKYVSIFCSINFNSGSCPHKQFMFPAMALRLLDCLVRVRLHVHERASLWPESRGNQNSVSEG